jgi:hypothetical protein
MINPLIQYPAPIDFRRSLISGGLLAGVTFAISLWMLFNGHFLVLIWTMQLAWIITIAAPLYVAFATAYIADRKMLDALSLTEISNQRLVLGYAFRILYQLRAVMTLMIGLMPVLTVGMLYLLIRKEVLEARQFVVPPSKLEVLMATSGFVGIASGLWLLPPIAAVVGLNVHLWLGRPFLSGLIASGIVLAVTALGLLALVFVIVLPQSAICIMFFCGPTTLGIVMLLAWNYARLFAGEFARRPTI